MVKRRSYDKKSPNVECSSNKIYRLFVKLALRSGLLGGYKSKFPILRLTGSIIIASQMLKTSNETIHYHRGHLREGRRYGRLPNFATEVVYGSRRTSITSFLMRGLVCFLSRTSRSLPCSHSPPRTTPKSMASIPSTPHATGAGLKDDSSSDACVAGFGHFADADGQCRKIQLDVYN